MHGWEMTGVRWAFSELLIAIAFAFVFVFAIASASAITTTETKRNKSVTHLTDILVANTADLLDVGGTLGDTLQGVTGELELILNVGRGEDLNTGLGSDAADVLLTEEVTDLNLSAVGLGVLLDVDVDGEMGVDVTHLVQEAAGDTDDQVVDDGADGTEGSDTLAGTVVQLDGDDLLLGAAEGDGDVGEVLDELAAGALDSDNTRTNVHLDCGEKQKLDHLSEEHSKIKRKIAPMPPDEKLNSTLLFAVLV